MTAGPFYVTGNHKKRKKGKEKEKPASRVLTEPPDFDTFAEDIPRVGYGPAEGRVKNV